ncbi:CASTOR/POLLUX-related putative ion channel [Microcella sp.]|uniref:CASTOR/POLLUX-related putative ion channel n=1 Tax=Microcella sp. TaxID=1913979 RepID=UPI003919C06D
MHRPTLAERLRYWFDSVMARGTISLMGLLALASAAFILAVTGIVVAFRLYPTRLPDGFESNDPQEILWGSLVRILSSGSFREDEGWGFRIAMLFVTIAGLIVVASLIGIISSAFDRKLLELRRGRSRVLEQDHTVILGWSSKVVPIVAELLAARGSERRTTIVVLSQRDKVDVEDELRERIQGRRGVRIIVRSGDPMDPSDLAMTSPESARAIIIVSPDAAAEPDIEVIKAALALSSTFARRAGLRAIGELRSMDLIDAAHLAGGEFVRWVVGDDLIGRLTLHSVRHEGISVVLRDLLDFRGDEFHLSRRPDLVGTAFGTARRRVDRASLVGIVRDERVQLNPPGELELRTSDELIFIAADNDSIDVGAEHPFEPDRIDVSGDVGDPPGRVLILGFHRGMRTLLSSLHDYVPAGSTAHLVSSEPIEGLVDVPGLSTVIADTTSRTVLEGLAIETFDHIIVVPYKDTLSSQSADARTLVTLLHVRALRGADTRVKVVTEMLDDRNAEIANLNTADDVIVSDLMASRLLAQVSQTPRLVDVFDQLFAHRGSETYLRPVERYVRLGSPITVATLIEAASRRGETFMGFRSTAHRHESPHFGVVLNPATSASVDLRPGDHLIVLADR